MKVKIVNKSPWPDPSYATEASAGMDLRACIDEPLLLRPLERALVPTGIFLELPVGYEAQIRPRSGLATKCGITVINAPGTVDADFRGELRVSLVNLSNDPFEVVPGERIAQMVVAAHEKVEWEDVEALSETVRGTGGWGSTGSK
ncbi:MAG: dUTP diphosphatase [Bacteroidales bacterium]|nr:dUTP diphosphatase [Bacteroidales bacterium]